MCEIVQLRIQSKALASSSPANAYQLIYNDILFWTMALNVKSLRVTSSKVNSFI